MPQLHQCMVPLRSVDLVVGLPVLFSSKLVVSASCPPFWCSCFHCPDYHASMAPLYVEPLGSLPVFLILHNAAYQGKISQPMDPHSIKLLAKMFNLPVRDIEKYMVHEGNFAMLNGCVRYIRRFQDGVGVCAVSLVWLVGLFVGLKEILFGLVWTSCVGVVSVPLFPLWVFTLVSLGVAF